MVVLAASICTRGGKAVLSRQFREVNRSRIEGLLAAFPKLVDFGTQHTTVEQDNVRYVYQPLDELYMVLITNRQSNILQDIDSLHLFAQVVGSICKSLDEREILRHAYELMSAFDEIISLGYRENLSLSQIKTFLEMESHEERIQEIISRNKELEATEERKRKAKQLEMQRKEMSRNNRSAMPKAPSYSIYTPPPRAPTHSTYDSYEAEKNKTFKPSTSKGKGMQLGKKSKTTDMFERVKGDLGSTIEESSPLVPAKQMTVAEHDSHEQINTKVDRDAIHIVISETISARFDQQGTVKSLGVKGDLNLRISDPAFAKVKLDLVANASHNAQFKTHPNVDKTQFNTSKQIQLKDVAKSFPVNTPVGVLRWNVTIPATAAARVAPITFNVWVNEGADGGYALTIEYELSGPDALRDVVVTIPYSTMEPSISSHDAVYEVSGDTVEWTIGSVDDTNRNGSFELEAQADDIAEFFPMGVQFSKTTPFVEVDVNSVSLVELNEAVNFSKDIRSVAENYTIEQD